MQKNNEPWYILFVTPGTERAVCRRLGKRAKSKPDQAPGYVMVRGEKPPRVPLGAKLLGKATGVDAFLHAIHNEWRRPEVGSVVRVMIPGLPELHKKLRRVVAVDNGTVYVMFRSKRVPIPGDMVREVEVGR